jgi:type I restriction enzyme M protein
LMNLDLHRLEPTIRLGDSIYDPPGPERFNVVLTNPPFGVKGANQSPDRDDFTVPTSNKQLNFIQHVLTILKPGGRAAIVVPDNVLFANQAADVFEVLMQDCDVHTVLRCPRGTFSPYTEGTKANVIFFIKGPPTVATWIYDGRANVPKITKKSRPLSEEHFREFEQCYGHDPNGRSSRSAAVSQDGRWRSFALSEIRERHIKVDSFKWIRDEELDDPDEIGEPDELLAEAAAELQLALEKLSKIQHVLGTTGGGAA